MSRAQRPTACVRLAAIVLVVCAATGCSNAGRASSGGSPHITVFLTRDAHIFLNGRPATLGETERAIADMKGQGGAFWYARENGDRPPTAGQQVVFEELFPIVMTDRLPIRLYTDATFTRDAHIVR